MLLSTLKSEYVVHLKGINNYTLLLCEITNVFIDAFLLFQCPFSSVRTV